MRLALALVTGISILVLVGCSSSDGREASLRETVANYVEAFQDRDPAAYDFNHDSYKEGCSAVAAEQLFDTVDFWYGPDWDSAEPRILWLEIDEHRATVDYDLYIDGRSIGFAEPDIFWLYEDGRWWRASDNPNPCSANTAFGSGFWAISTLEEAAIRTGYDIATPSFVPDGYERADEIAVVTRFRLGRSVEQVWGAADGTAGFSLRQDPGLIGLNGGEPFEIAGVTGERKLDPADPSIPRVPMLNFSWHDDEFTYLLTGFMGGSLTEDVLLKIAASIAID